MKEKSGSKSELHQGEGVKVGALRLSGGAIKPALCGITSGLYTAANLYKQAFVYCLGTDVYSVVVSCFNMSGVQKSRDRFTR